jgi:hypothetical protein
LPGAHESDTADLSQVLWDVEGAIAKLLVDELRKGDDNKQFYCTTKAMKLSQ